MANYSATATTSSADSKIIFVVVAKDSEIISRAYKMLTLTQINNAGKIHIARSWFPILSISYQYQYAHHISNL